MPRSVAAPHLTEREYPYALAFDGGTDRISFSNVFAFDRTSAFSVGGYFRNDEMALTSNRRLHSKTNTTGTIGWTTYLDSTTGCLRFLLSNAVGNRIIVESVEIPKPGRYYFFTFTYDGSGSAAGVKLYLAEAGLPLTAQAAVTIVEDTLTLSSIEANTFRLGSRSDNTLCWLGLMHTMFVCSTATLTLDQVQRIYYDETWPASTSSLWLSMNANGNSGTLIDEVGANAGTITGPLWSRTTAFALHPQTRYMPFSITSNALTDRVTWADDPVLNPAVLTAEVFFRCSITQAGARDICGKYTNTTTSLQAWTISLSATNNTISATVNIGGSNFTTPATGQSLLFIKPGVWYHAVLVFDGVEAILYVNGRRLSSIAAAGSLQSHANPLHLFTRSGTNLSMFGDIALFRLFAQAATPSEVRRLYLDNQKFATPIVECLMSDGSGLSVSNTGSYGIAGTATSVDWTTETPLNQRSIIPSARSLAP